MSADAAQPRQDQPPQAALLELSGRARDVVAALTTRDEHAASLYEGALRVLADAQNPARLRLAACGLRELLGELHDAPKPQDLKQRVRKLRDAWDVSKRTLGVAPDAQDDSEAQDDPDSEGSTFTQTLDAFFVAFDEDYPGRRKQAGDTIEKLDPSGRTAPPVVHQARGDVWMEFSGYFSAVLHGGKRPSEDEFRSQVDAFEVFLLDVLRPQTFADIGKIDDLIAEGPPGD
jgi:hypothetical protein